MDADLVKTFAAAVAGGLTSLAMLPMLFKGKLRFEREFTQMKERFDDRIKDLTAGYEERIRVENARHVEVVRLFEQEKERLQDGWEDTQRDLREQYNLTAEVTKQLFGAINFLQSLAGLASKDRRQSGATDDV